MSVTSPASTSASEQVDLDELCINTIRTLAMDAVQKANSGHPGTPMALAPVAYALWQQFLRYDPKEPAWPNRDRFVLSNGHASMLLYALLHLAGVKAKDGPAVSLDDIKLFRQLDSKCPGHPEYGLTVGVETNGSGYERHPMRIVFESKQVDNSNCFTRIQTSLQFFRCDLQWENQPNHVRQLNELPREQNE